MCIPYAPAERLELLPPARIYDAAPGRRRHPEPRGGFRWRVCLMIAGLFLLGTVQIVVGTYFTHAIHIERRHSRQEAEAFLALPKLHYRSSRETLVWAAQGGSGGGCGRRAVASRTRPRRQGRGLFFGWLH